MAWTTARTWADGEFMTATLFNAHIRDNLNAIRRVAVQKTANESVTSSTVLQNDDHLLFAVAPNEIWVARAVLYVTGATAGDMQVAWSGPSGVSGSHGHVSLAQGASTTAFDVDVEPETTLTTASAVGTSASASTSLHYVCVINGSTAGNVNLQWAQLTSSGTATTVLAGSSLVAYRIS